ncbi:MAG: HU family DNA-binding protein [bacterium]|nr:HU family DNA-binding protein [bacterium]
MPTYDKIGKREFVEIIQLSMPEGALTRTDAAAIHDNIMSATVAAVKKKGVVTFADVGRLKYTVRKARMGRNPQTGEAIKIPMKKTVKFTVAKELKSIR